MIVSKNTQNALIEMIGEAFTLNRKVDRMVSVLGTKFACNQAADLIHYNIAHIYPVWADVLGSECLERYNIPVYYPSTPSGGQDYNSVMDIVKDLEKVNLDFQSMLMGCIKIAFDNKDIHIYADLLGLLTEVNKIVGQTILLSDKIDLYKDNITAFDHDIKDFWILEDEH